MVRGRLATKATEYHPRQVARIGRELGQDRLQGDSGGAVGGEAVNSGGDRGVGERGELVFARERDGGSVAGCQQRVLVPAAARSTRGTGH